MITSSVLAQTQAFDSNDGMYAGLLLIRVVLGLTLAAHGYYKFFKGGKIEGTARWFDSIGMKPNGRIHALMAASMEIISGLLFAAGFLTPFAAAGFVGLMLVAGWTVNRPNGFFSANHGYEFNLTLATVAVGVAAIGPGKYSVDWSLDLTFVFDPKIAVGIAAGLGFVAGAGLIAACFRPPAPAGAGDASAPEVADEVAAAPDAAEASAPADAGDA